MYIDLSVQPLPKVYTRKGKECYLDPIRQKLIYITPEETVRQQVISHLLLNDPPKMVHRSTKNYRSNPLNQGGTAPKLADPTTPGNSYEVPAPWIEWIEEYAVNARIKTQ